MIESIEKRLIVLAATALMSGTLHAQNCTGLPDKSELSSGLVSVADPSIGGLFGGTRMWAAVVNRGGKICAFATSTPDPDDVWPGSEAIAKAKAYTANAFSLDVLALSTARLYTFTQPGHSLWSLGLSNLFDADALSQGLGINQVEGGLIFFGGGVPIYNENGEIIGGLGVSGDTSCADHEVAKALRDLLDLNPPGGPLVDDISYSSADGANVFTHPLCLNTRRNGLFIGDEAPAAGY